jgi:histidinol-phosphate aminotransferase
VPSNPIGDRIPDPDVAQIRNAAGGVVVVDAAYSEFTGDHWEVDDDVVVLGTLSKAFGLAGIRVGYALADPERAAALHAVRPPGSISTLSAALAVRALDDAEWAAANVERISAAREDLAAKLRALGLEPRDSVTNFVLVPIGPAAPEVSAALMARGLVSRDFGAAHPLADHLRFTARTPEQHNRLVTVLEEVLR